MDFKEAMEVVQNGGKVRMASDKEIHLVKNYSSEKLQWRSKDFSIIRSDYEFELSHLSEKWIEVEKDKKFVDSLPEEVKNRMLDCQENEGNPRDITVFYDDVCSESYEGGFSWSSTKEGKVFWRTILLDKDVEHFYTKYPKDEKHDYYRIVDEELNYVGNVIQEDFNRFGHFKSQGKLVFKTLEEGKHYSYPNRTVVHGKIGDQEVCFDRKGLVPATKEEYENQFKTEEKGLTFSEAMEKLNKGYSIKLPEWEGFWYLGEEGNVKVNTRDGEILDTPRFHKYYNRDDWEIVRFKDLITTAFNEMKKFFS